MYGTQDIVLTLGIGSGLAACALAVAAGPRFPGRRIRRILRRHLALVPGSLSLLGLGLVLPSSASASASRHSRLAHGSHPAPPWSPGEGVPPPPSSGTGAPPPWRSPRSPEPAKLRLLAHRQKGDLAEPLFPPAAGPRTARREDRDAGGPVDPELAEAMRRHPAGKGLRRNEQEGVTDRYVVKRGDSLWSIAGAVLDTDDLVRIARYWPKIHRANRASIGANPDVLVIGQILSLPPEAA